MAPINLIDLERHSALRDKMHFLRGFARHCPIACAKVCASKLKRNSRGGGGGDRTRVLEQDHERFYKFSLADFVGKMVVAKLTHPRSHHVDSPRPVGHSPTASPR